MLLFVLLFVSFFTFYFFGYNCFYFAFKLLFSSGRFCINVVMANGGWRECANWLTRCGAIRADHKVNWPESTIDDLAHTLKDGVILCNLLSILEPGCLGAKDINQKPQMAQVIILNFDSRFIDKLIKLYSSFIKPVYKTLFLWLNSIFIKWAWNKIPFLFGDAL